MSLRVDHEDEDRMTLQATLEGVRDLRGWGFKHRPSMRISSNSWALGCRVRTSSKREAVTRRSS